MPNNLVLGNVMLRVWDSVIDQLVLDNDFRNWRGRDLGLGVGQQYFDWSDAQVIRVMAFQYMPFTISASALTIMRTSLVRFPYSINGKRNFQAYTLRMWPEVGAIDDIRMHKKYDLSLRVDSYSSQGIVMQVGGKVRLEIYLQMSGLLDAALPPEGYEEEVFI